MRPNHVVSTLVAEFDCQTRPLYRNGVALTQSDATSAQDTYIQWMCVLCDIGVLSLECNKRVVRHIIKDLMSHDIMEPLNALADALSCLLRDKHGFKAHVRRVSPHLWQFIRPHWEKHTTGQIDSTRILIQVLSFPGRLSLNDIDLTSESIESYLNTEASMSGDEVRNSYVPHLHQIVKRWTRSMNFDRMKFKHGPGAVAGHGRTSLETKYKDLSHDHLIRYAFCGPHRVKPLCPLERYSQTIFVAKNYKSFRTISMESSTLMFYQQGVLSAINDHVESTSYLRKRIGFKDQSRNRLMAQEGSLLRNYATIDLSAASDSVSWELVKAVFGGTRLYRYLLATRSRSTLLPNGQTLNLKKFAPMGSALCFPIQTMLFASICEFVTREHGISTDYSVYGDDIIVPTQCVSDVLLILDALGFTVNDTKSFTDPLSPFRESCGGEYWNGVDVTPYRIARNYTSDLIEERYQSLVDGANECLLRGYSALRYFYIAKQSEVVIPYYGPLALNSYQPTNFHTERRWNKNLHRYECRVSELRPSSKKKKPVCESIRYNHWLRSTADRELVIEPFVSDVSRSSMVVRQVWKETIPASDYNFSYPSETNFY